MVSFNILHYEWDHLEWKHIVVSCLHLCFLLCAFYFIQSRYSSIFKGFFSFFIIFSVLLDFSHHQTFNLPLRAHLFILQTNILFSKKFLVWLLKTMHTCIFWCHVICCSLVLDASCQKLVSEVPRMISRLW